MRDNAKLSELIRKLKDRDNHAYKFFEELLNELGDHSKQKDALKRLSSSFAITQYADFTSEEEKLLAEVINDIQ
jgi:hypothetical protein